MDRQVTPIVLTLLLLTAGAVPAVAGATSAAGPTHQQGAIVGDAGEPAVAQQLQAAELQSNSSGCSYPFSATDATGHVVTVDEAPERVVVVGPSGAQTMWQIGAMGDVVGAPVSQYTEYIPNISATADITGESGTTNTEAILDQNPDLVLLANINDDELARDLRKAGVTTYKFEKAETIRDISEKTELTGSLTGNCEGAQAADTWMTDQLAEISGAVQGEPRPSVLYVSSYGGQLASYAPGSFIHVQLTRAGGQNVLANNTTMSGYTQISGEFVVEENPEWLVVTYDPSQNETAENPKALLPDNDAIEATQAYEDGNVVAVPNNYFFQPGPKVVEPVDQMASAFHSDAYAAANVTLEANPALQENAGADEIKNNSEPDDSTGSGGLPGFGPGVAMAAFALLGSGLLVKSRG